MTRRYVDDRSATANGDWRGSPMSDPMSKHCGFDKTQQYAPRAPWGHECNTLLTSSNTPSLQQCVINRSHGSPSGCIIKAQLILPALRVTGLMNCSLTMLMPGPMSTLS